MSMVQTQIIFIIILSLTLSACAPSSVSIWGVVETPTPGLLNHPDPLTDPFIVQDVPMVFPTSTAPPIVETEAAYTPTITPTPGAGNPSPVNMATADVPLYDTAPFLYYAQSGDMLSAVAGRFGVEASEIISDADLTRTTLIDPGTLLVIPNRISEEMSPNIQIMPDAEVIYSFTAADFDVREYVEQADGYLQQIPGLSWLHRLDQW